MNSCTICGNPTRADESTCPICHDVEYGLDHYLSSDQGRENVRQLFEDAEVQGIEIEAGTQDDDEPEPPCFKCDNFKTSFTKHPLCGDYGSKEQKTVNPHFGPPAWCPKEKWREHPCAPCSSFARGAERLGCAERSPADISKSPWKVLPSMSIPFWCPKKQPANESAPSPRRSRLQFQPPMHPLGEKP